MRKIVVRYRGIIASILEASAEYYELSNPTLGSLVESLSSRHGYDLKMLIEDNPTYIILVNGRQVDLTKDIGLELAAGSEVNILAAIAGGCC